MIEKSLDQVQYSNIDAFVNAAWPEGKTVEYKRDTYGSADADKKELLKDVSSFANTQGGDMPLVLLCPAWKRWGTAKIATHGTAILHSRADEMTPFAESE